MTTILRAYSYLYHGVLALFLVGISALALFGGTHNLNLEMLPWTGATLTYVLFFSALFGLASVLLALKGIARPLFMLWSVVVPLMMLKGYFFGSYRFLKEGSFSMAVYLILGALLAIAGAWSQLRKPVAMRQGRYSAAVSR